MMPDVELLVTYLEHLANDDMPAWGSELTWEGEDVIEEVTGDALHRMRQEEEGLADA